MTTFTPLALAELTTVESIATILLYVSLGAGWAFFGYRKNRAVQGESFQKRKTIPVLAAGGIVGLGLVLSGQAFESGHVMAVAGFLVPLLDKVWNAAMTATETASESAHNEESIAMIALAVAEAVDKEIKVEDALRVLAEYENRFGPLDPDAENVDTLAKELRKKYDEGGAGAVFGEFNGRDGNAPLYPDHEPGVTLERGMHPDPEPDPDPDPEPESEPEMEPESEPEPDSDSYSWPTSSLLRGPNPTPEYDTDDDDDDEEIHESA